MGASQRTVRRTIKALIAAGLLLKEARYDSRGLQTSNLYTLIRPSTVPDQGPKGKVPGNDTAEPEPESPVTSCGEQGGNDPGCSGGTGGVVCDNNPDDLLDQPSFLERYTFEKLTKDAAPWSSGEKTLVKLAATFFNRMAWPVTVEDAFYSLDRDNLQVVLEALRMRYS